MTIVFAGEMGRVSHLVDYTPAGSLIRYTDTGGQDVSGNSIREIKFLLPKGRGRNQVLHSTRTSSWDIYKLSCHKLDGVGPVDNRPSTDLLHYFVQRINKKI